MLKTQFWGILGVIFTVIFGVAGIYYSLDNDEVRLEYLIIDEFPIIEINKVIEGLKVTYREIDVVENDISLFITRINISVPLLTAPVGLTSPQENS